MYYHHGIYISDNEVIHFSGVKSDSILHWENCRVISTDLDTFLCGGKLEIKIYSKCDSKKLKNIDDIGICMLTNKDVVRHPLVQKIVEAYDIYEKKSISKDDKKRFRK